MSKYLFLRDILHTVWENYNGKNEVKFRETDQLTSFESLLKGKIKQNYASIERLSDYFVII